MKVDRLTLGAFETNCYILRQGPDATGCLIIDAGLGAGELVDFLQENGLSPAGVLLTHGHADHMAGVPELRRSFPDVKVYIHKLDAEMLTGAKDNLSELAGILLRTEPAEFLLDEGDIIEQAGIRLQVLETAGHTPGGISLYSKDEGIVFAGDALFADSIGRTDFPGGSMSQLLKSIRQKLFTLPDETLVYPGHGPTTTIAHEKTHNPFLQ
ncbi:MAG: MBL fold metallo-hydrolase [Planctomycetota bacterium]|jgi:glyoxylase-like metal-dependent hydrolase (beta-lactamase superfamily II)